MTYSFRKSLRLLLSLLIFPTISWASTAGDNVPYQTYLDFAQNGGSFQPGAVNIPILNKEGQTVGIIPYPFPDFAAINTPGAYATLIAPQYVVSVAHNGGYKTVNFGHSEATYTLVKRNECGKELPNCQGDFHMPRLNKLVTEVAPFDIASASDFSNTQHLFKGHLKYFVRIGSGVQNVWDNNSKKAQHVYDAYTYETGGILDTEKAWVYEPHNHTPYLLFPYQENKTFLDGKTTNPLSNLATPGDSGSPLLAYDAEHKKWVLVGVLAGAGQPYEFYVDLYRQHRWESIQEEQKSTRMELNTHPEQTLMFSTISNSTTHDLYFSGGGTLQIDKPIAQNSYGLYFQDDYQVTLPYPASSSPTSNTAQTPSSQKDPIYWMGSGIVVTAEKTVVWEVPGFAHNRSDQSMRFNWEGDTPDVLHKLGKGTLLVQGTGVNPGDLRVGEGWVYLNQKPNPTEMGSAPSVKYNLQPIHFAGRTQAFNTVWLTSGRGGIKLLAEQQLNPDHIRFDFRGGIFDLNGHDLIVHVIHAADIGAVWDNQNREKSAQLTFAPNLNKVQLFPGLFKGNLNLQINSNRDNPIVFTGGSDIQGDIRLQDRAHLLISGVPTPHGYAPHSVQQTLATRFGDDSVYDAPVKETQADWRTRTFKLQTLELGKSSRLDIGRNAIVNVQNIMLHNAHLSLGEPMIYIDYAPGRIKKDDEMSIQLKQVITAHSDDFAQLKGNIQGDAFTIHIDQGRFEGGIQGALRGMVHMGSQSLWQLVQDSSLNTLLVDPGAELVFADKSHTAHLLKLAHLDGNGALLKLHLYLETGKNDRLTILQTASGSHKLSLEPVGNKALNNLYILASAPEDSDANLFTAEPIQTGFSTLTPRLKSTLRGKERIWYLDKPGTVLGLFSVQQNKRNKAIAESALRANQSALQGALMSTEGLENIADNTNPGPAWIQVQTRYTQTKQDREQLQSTALGKTIKRGQHYFGIGASARYQSSRIRGAEHSARIAGLQVYAGQRFSNAFYMEETFRAWKSWNRYDLQALNMGTQEASLLLLSTQFKIAYQIPLGPLTLTPSATLGLAHQSAISLMQNGLKIQIQPQTLVQNTLELSSSLSVLTHLQLKAQLQWVYQQSNTDYSLSDRYQSMNDTLRLESHYRFNVETRLVLSQSLSSYLKLNNDWSTQGAYQFQVSAGLSAEF